MSRALRGDVRGCSPEMAAKIRSYRSQLLLRWSQAARHAAAARCGEGGAGTICERLPAMLDQVADMLQGPANVPSADIGRDLGEQRPGEDPCSVIAVLTLVDDLLVQELSRFCNRSLLDSEVKAIHRATAALIRGEIRRLVDSQTQLLHEAAEAQSKHLSFLSHDLRGTLNSISLSIELLQQEMSGERRFQATLRDLEGMRRSIVETVGTMDRFLKAESLRKRKVQPKLVALDLREVAGELCNQFRAQAAAKGLQMVCQATENYPAVSDREMITLVLRNLLDNAVKYSSAGAITVRISRESIGGCDSWVVCVNDQGPGISKQSLLQLFQPFARGQTYGQSGVGLGLCIAREAAECVGAKLWAESEPGVGSTFYLAVPLSGQQSTA